MMTSHSKEQNERFDEIQVYSFCKLKAHKSSSNEFFSTVKLEINNFENDGDNGITIGHWKYDRFQNEWLFVPISASHWEIVSDLFYFKSTNNLPKNVGEFCEANVAMETIRTKD